jgi:adenine-specific DNA methylase
MIERWFPCKEVSENSEAGWGSGNSEASLFTWFARRPLAQAKAAVLTSLLPWPDDPAEQKNLQDLVRSAFADADAKHDDLIAELNRWFPSGASMLDPFCGRAMIPLEAARIGVRAWGIDYSFVASVAGQLLADFPLRDWSDEPPVPFSNDRAQGVLDVQPRLLGDAVSTIEEVSDRFEKAMTAYYPKVDGQYPWGYIWAVTLPCQECGHRFPLTGSLVLRNPGPGHDDPGQSYRIEADAKSGQYEIVVHEGPPDGVPTRVVAQGKSRFDAAGKVAVCPFCGHVHPKHVYTRLAAEGLGVDDLLVAADLDPVFGKTFRVPTDEERQAAIAAGNALALEPPFHDGLAAVPDEPIPPGNTWTVQASVYGAKSYGDMCNARQSLGFVTIARTIDDIGRELLNNGNSIGYATALCGYATAVMVRKLRRATRGCTLDPKLNKVNDVFATESSLNFSFDYFETGLADGPGSWESVSGGTIAALRNQFRRAPGRPAVIVRGNAVELPLKSKSVSCVVTDPPYDAMIDYSDASDLSFVWMKRALGGLVPELLITADPNGLQEKTDEIIVKKGGSSSNDHRTQAHYDRLIARAFAEAARVVDNDGVVTIVFGHGDPEVWHRLLSAVTEGGLVLTGSWPARTEKGGKVGFSNIVTTLTLACRKAPAERPVGRVQEVDAEVRAVIADRIPLWDAAGLALTDQLMASAGPAMEVVGRYSMIRDKKGDAVELDRYLPLARRAVEDAADIQIDALPLGTFDVRTRFALFWVRLFGRAVAPASEARWQRLASDLSEAETAGILVNTRKGVRLRYGGEFDADIGTTAAVIDVALALAGAGKSVADSAEILIASGRSEDLYLWAALAEFGRRVPEADSDGETWTWLVRNRAAVVSATLNVEAARQREIDEQETKDQQPTLFGGDN